MSPPGSPDQRRVLSTLRAIARLISARAPLQQVLDGVTAGARDLIGDEIAVVFLVDRDDPGTMVLSSYSGISDQTAGAIRRMPSTSGVRGKALLEGRLVVMEHVQSDPDVRRETVAEGVEAAMAVPLFESEEIVGALVVATRRKGRTYSLEERERLMTFAQHAS
ncbi:MAG TPA: GAF domain-containing protein, partial [Actinomycetota bacterium]|nr:GAF domain-containing protein [Actinomycetota bacterium]